MFCAGDLEMAVMICRIIKQTILTTLFVIIISSNDVLLEQHWYPRRNWTKQMKLSIQWVFTLFKQFFIQRLRICLRQYVSLCVNVSFKIERKTNMWSVVQFKSFSNKGVRQETPYYTFFSWVLLNLFLNSIPFQETFKFC